MQYKVNTIAAWAKLLSLGGRYSYKLLAKKHLPLQLQVTVLKSLAVAVTSNCFKIFGRCSYKFLYFLLVIIQATIEKGQKKVVVARTNVFIL